MKIRIKVDDLEFEGILENTKILDLLPLEVEVEDYASNEKIFYLPKKLSVEGEPAGYEPRVGDICYYAPWGNIAIFYKDFSYSTGLIKLGEITDNVDKIKNIKNSKLKIEIIE
ncbi:cyclophilin-like fold protein [Halobacteriovorax sp. HFRX-2_2]|uniref:cyclophilin-like fold protein n=1 Tax=unclassified Halobacteriovorax TaxID=2639665 RepID=UPI00371BF0B2